MPSAEVCPISTMATPAVPVMETTTTTTNFNITICPSDVDGLVLEIKKNLRLSGPPMMKAISCSHLSRKSSRASPYRVPGKYFCDSCDATCVRHKNKQQDLDHQQDPYELLQALLRSENLINEAVRRVQMGLTTKKFYYDSEEESSRSPRLRL